MGLLLYIRSWDSGTKARCTFIVALGVTFLIGLVWVSTFSARLSPVSLDGREEKRVGEMYTEPRGFGDVVDDAKLQLGALMNAKDELIDTLEEVAVQEEKSEGTAVIDNDSHLGTLTMPEVPVEEEMASTAPQHEKTVLLEVTDAVPPVAEEEEEAPELYKEPRIILIGTTTSQKTE